MILPERWNDGPAAVNAEIEAIIEEQRIERHAALMSRVAALEARINELREQRAVGGMIGHNQPPEPIIDVLDDLPAALETLGNAPLEAPEPEPIRQSVLVLRRALAALFGWTLDKVDTFVTEAIKKAGALTGALVAAGLAPYALDLASDIAALVDAARGYLLAHGFPP